ncbi:MAG: Hpt domain-containing protein [Rhodocyclaceae bacterium]
MNEQAGIDWVLLEELREALGDGLDEIVAQFFSLLPGHLQGVDAGLAAADFDAVRSCAHTLKGSAANLGFVELHDVAKAMEQAVRGGRTEELAALGARLHAAATAAEGALRARGWTAS